MLELIVPGDIPINADGQMTTTLMAESEDELKSLLIKVKEESEKTDLKLNDKKKKTKICHPVSSLHGK